MPIPPPPLANDQAPDPPPALVAKPKLAAVVLVFIVEPCPPCPPLLLPFVPIPLVGIKFTDCTLCLTSDGSGIIKELLTLPPNPPISVVPVYPAAPAPPPAVP